MIRRLLAAIRRCRTHGRRLSRSSATSGPTRSIEMNAELTSGAEAGAVLGQFEKNLESFKRLLDGPATVSLSVSFPLPLRPATPSSPSENLKGS